MIRVVGDRRDVSGCLVCWVRVGVLVFWFRGLNRNSLTRLIVCAFGVVPWYLEQSNLASECRDITAGHEVLHAHAVRNEAHLKKVVF
jgi:hypothetical protein